MMRKIARGGLVVAGVLSIGASSIDATQVAITQTAAVTPPALVATGSQQGPHIYPTVEDVFARRASAPPSGDARATVNHELKYGGGIDGIGVTTGPPAVYLVFWGSQWGMENPPGSSQFSNDALGVAPRLIALLTGIGVNDESWSGVMTQYCEGVPVGTMLCPSTVPHVGYPTGGALAGVWSDTATAAPASASGGQIAAEAVNAAAHFGNTMPESNRNTQYVIVAPTGSHPDGFNTPGANFCAWHDYTVSATYGDLAFTNLPYVPDMGRSCGANFVNEGPAGALDGVTMVEGHEYAETITDQLPIGGWVDVDGDENADKCAWLSTGPGRAQNVSFATGTFAMQGTWSNDSQACQIAHPIFGMPGLPDDFGVLTTPRSGFAAPGDAVSALLWTATISGNPQIVDLSVTGIPPDATVSLPSSSIATDDSETLTITTADTTPFGTYPITITAVGSVTHATTYTLLVGTPPAPLENGIAVTGLAGAADSDQYWEFDVPDLPSIFLDFTLVGVGGNVGLDVRREALPTDDDYDCSSRGSADVHTCTWFGGGDRWFVRVHGAATFSGVALQATYAVPVRFLNGEVLPHIPTSAGSQRFFWTRVPPGVRKFLAKISGGGADLYMRPYALPSPFANACAPLFPGRRSQKCQIFDPRPAVWYIGLYGYGDSDRLKLKFQYR